MNLPSTAETWSDPGAGSRRGTSCTPASPAPMMQNGTANFSYLQGGDDLLLLALSVQLLDLLVGELGRSPGPRGT